MKVLPEVVLKEVADYIERHGHCQNGSFKDGEAVCYFGARAILEGLMVRDFHVENIGRVTFDNAAALLVGRAGLGTPHDITRWNDRTPTAEVLRVLRGES